ncbi:MAG TPA: transferrin receptor-like dimerization domain-containing protein [Gemmatimonadaceae bacterium]|jgi:N-acetylated-alpha-linked acidic dipeptidase|nr:transferrin receptor-like dimerization domain-containing protein [Gemmatimonadaceae bacterium]
MRTLFSSLLISATGLALAPLPADAPPRGFFPQSVQAERDLETRFKTMPDPAHMREAMRRLSARPHHVGSPYDKDNAEWILAQFKSYGWDAHIENFDVLFPTPIDRVVELVSPTTFKASLQETALANDPTSNQQSEQLPSYNAYSIDGDVTGPLVFVNYGVPADYEELEQRGVSVKGAIVIAKYGGSWRGIKPKVAAEHGAIGCLIYSDPRDDGYAGGGVFPNGPMRPAQGVQRGSVADMPIYPGDPLTPGVGATKDAKRLTLAQAATITKIPVLPISYGDAQPLLAALGGPIAPAAWRGGLPITYRLGAGPAKVHLRVKSDWSLKTLHDVIAKLPGTTEADQWVIRGNHHDAWVNGAQDPISGLVAELEEARALGALYQQGWRPKRTIIYAAWDGEEPGLLGSTEWVETHAEELKAHAVAYLNSDTNSRGYFEAAGSHSLEKFVNGVAMDVEDPESGVSSWKRLQASRILDGSPETRRDARDREDLRISALGSGSDYSSFIDHLGIASLNFGYGGEDDGGIYHSIYDDFYWFMHFSDSAFVYERALAQAAGITVLRLANADLLPFAFTNLAETAQGYVKDLQSLRDRRAEQIAERNRQIEEGLFKFTSDPRDPVTAPQRQQPAPQLNFAPLLNALDSLNHSASRYEKAYTRAVTEGRSTVAKSVNEQLIQAERALTSTDGLKNRPWYVHMLYAPGFYTGYGVKTIPGVREAIEQGQWQDADREIARAALALYREATFVSGIAATLSGGSP